MKAGVACTPVGLGLSKDDAKVPVNCFVVLTGARVMDASYGRLQSSTPRVTSPVTRPTPTPIPFHRSTTDRTTSAGDSPASGVSSRAVAGFSRGPVTLIRPSRPQPYLGPPPFVGCCYQPRCGLVRAETTAQPVHDAGRQQAQLVPSPGPEHQDRSRPQDDPPDSGQRRYRIGPELLAHQHDGVSGPIIRPRSRVVTGNDPHPQHLLDRAVPITLHYPDALRDQDLESGGSEPMAVFEVDQIDEELVAKRPHPLVDPQWEQAARRNDLARFHPGWPGALPDVDGGAAGPSLLDVHADHPNTLRALVPSIDV